MKTCMIWGDLTSDKASEQYPTVTVCDECVEANPAGQDGSPILNVSAYDKSLGDTCELCEKTLEEEDEERGGEDERTSE